MVRPEPSVVFCKFCFPDRFVQVQGFVRVSYYFRLLKLFLNLNGDPGLIDTIDISCRQSMALASVSPAEQTIFTPVQSNYAEDALDKLLVAIEEKFSNRLGLLHDPVIKKTLQRSSTNPRFDEASAAHLAIKMCDFEMVKALKAAGANFFSVSAVMVACHCTGLPNSERGLPTTQFVSKSLKFSPRDRIAVFSSLLMVMVRLLYSGRGVVS